MTTETGPEIDAMLKQLLARQAVFEAVQTQLMLRLAGLFDQPQEFVRLVMAHAEENLRRGRDEATGEAKATATEAVAACDEYSMRLIAALTPTRTRQ